MTWAMACAASSTCLSVSEALGLGIGTNQCTSGCESPVTSRQARHVPQGSSAGCSHRTSWASHSANRCFPTPAGPVSSSTCGSLPRRIAWASRFRAVVVSDQWVQGMEGKLRTYGNRGSLVNVTFFINNNLAHASDARNGATMSKKRASISLDIQAPRGD